MLIGYARVSTAEQNPDHQVDALRRAGVSVENIHVDHASGAKSSRPQLDLVLALLREDDQLVITRLDRLGRSVLHLITLGAQLREKGVGLRVLEQGIDTATAEGRAMFGMLSVLAELQPEITVANTRDGLAAARARGRKGGRPPKLTGDQIALAQRLYDAGEHTVAQIADLIGVRRTTLYGHLNKTVQSAPTGGKAAARQGGSTDRPGVAGQPEVIVNARSALACPSCGHEPATRAEAIGQRADLSVTWLEADPERTGEVVAAHHCRRCQPAGTAHDIACAVCGDGPIVTDSSTSASADLAPSVQRWLRRARWQLEPSLRCPEHPAPAPPR
ncbi:recombinase family protein [Rhodococcus sp. D2-41]|uniref:Recombinase family protein n=1 Tax=Speluncibacter jeojiensis TaxID=2710754 RepID=A0A9X4RJ56_9ACTN|nr:recombinase family protein [Rhodococcus sp. D2-41]MDG3010628.1 recombinase family protein [Rhodococcus sp. D2-41]MDG3016806.1 recombinase family protein [Corynebacteriales bacterium D3-21]